MAKILVVEDNPQNLKLAALLLRRAGHEVATAYDSVEAEAALAKAIPELILMDLGLPGKDGFALTREFRERETTAHVPILAVTSFAMKGDEEKAFEAGCSGYLTKPIHAPAFLRVVARMLADPEASTRDATEASSKELP